MSPHIKGDLEIKAQGTSSLMQKEVRSQRLMTFMQTASNPALAPFVKWHTCLREIAKSLDIDPDQLINDPEKAAIYAQIMGMANGNQNNTAAAGGQGQMDQLEQYLQELRQQIQQELEVATSEQVMYQCQGKLALVQQILNLQEANKHSKLNDGNILIQIEYYQEQ